jgi:predicted protein tyrosine phosphatase
MAFPDLYIASHTRAKELLDPSSSSKNPVFTHVISINDPGNSPPTTLESHPGKQLVLYFDDLSSLVFREDFNPPSLDDLEKIITFGRSIAKEDAVLIHCTAGISRSSAAAVAVLASKLEPSPVAAERVFRHVQQVKPTIYPNARMVEFADNLLGYQGALVYARVKHYGDLEL